VNKAAQNAPAGLTPAEIEERRQRARRTAILLGALALCMYFGFILATGLRS
jgi:hypothetical protein